ncbi:unnamed protein product [Pedinophyceae sp. YPF-701]|nr:unnamed protein product [Pedinophyceae sp. YPF-701]
MRPVVAITVGAVAGAGVTALLLQGPHLLGSGRGARAQRRARKRSTDTEASAHAVAAFGLPTTEHVRYFEKFAVAWDPRSRNPRWVLEKLEGWNSEEPYTPSGATRERSSFREDEAFEERFRARLDDYRGSGYDRGHMAPAMNHKSSQKDMDETFYLTNVSPQVGAFNREYWGRFEWFCRCLARDGQYEDVYILTGPLFIPKKSPGGKKWEMRYECIGDPPAMVHVPTHFFKAVLAVPRDARAPAGGRRPGGGRRRHPPLHVAAFVMPNQAIDPATPLAAYNVPLTSLETVAGMKIFEGAREVYDGRGRAAIDDAGLSWQQAGKQIARAARVAIEDPGVPAGRITDAGDGASSELASAASHPPPASAAEPGADAVRATDVGAGGTRGAEAGGLSKEALEVLWAPKTADGAGVVHLCDAVRCELPPRDFWVRPGRKDKRESGGGGA